MLALQEGKGVTGLLGCAQDRFRPATTDRKDGRLKPAATKGEKNGIRENGVPRVPRYPVSCIYSAAGIYSDFALKRVARRGGRKPTFLLGRLECSADRLGSRSLWSGFGKNPRRRRAGSAFGRAGNR